MMKMNFDSEIASTFTNHPDQTWIKPIFPPEGDRCLEPTQKARGKLGEKMTVVIFRTQNWVWLFDVEKGYVA